MRLNVGCGEHYAKGWINLDLHEDGPKPDVVGSILNLPFDDATASRVYLGHILEHVSLDGLERALCEVKRVLTSDGQVLVVGPDINLTHRYEPLLIECVADGGRRWRGDEHQWLSTGEITLNYLFKAGFSAWEADLGCLAAGWPIVDRAAKWQFAIQAIKEW